MPPLTPLDIQHKEFTKAMRGYAMHEVDTFLDQVTEEFTRLQDEVTRLREQSAPGQQGGVPAQAAAPPPPPAAAPAPQQAAAPPSDPRAGEEAIARALVTRPTVVFADEPTGALDSRTASDVLDVFRRTAARLGQTVVLVTHDPRVAAVSDRVVFLADGVVADDLGAPTVDEISSVALGLGR